MCQLHLSGKEMEVEIKFFVDDADLERVRTDIKLLNARYIGKEFETNIIFENAEKTLRSNSIILRLRRNAKSTLTYKEPSVLDETSQKFKVKQEIEVEVNDFHKTRTILEKLGFHELLKYERKRETFHVGTLKILIDEMPFGFLLEIEGTGKDIQAIAEKLQLDWNRRIRESYVKIFEDLCRQANLPFKDLTFENFRKINLKGLGFERFIESYWEENG